MEEDNQVVQDILESTLSSEIISLPPGNNFDNISPVSEHRKLELEEITDNANVPRIKSMQGETQFYENVIRNNALSHIKSTLQENADMLHDKSILNDLLLSKNKGANNVIHDNLLVTNKNKAQIYTTIPYLCESSTPKKALTCHHIKQVQFLSPMDTINRERDLGATYQERYNSFSSYGNDPVLKRLNEIRHRLDVDSKDKVDDEVPELLPLSRLFVTQLNTQKQRTKDLEEELALNEASLAKTTRELEIVQTRLSRREEQLREAGSQLEKLQNDWQLSHKKLIVSRDTFRNQNDKLRQMLDILNGEKQKLTREVEDLHSKCKNYSSLQIEAEEMKLQLNTISKRYTEIFSENARITEQLKDSEETISHYSKEVESLTEDLLKMRHMLSEVSVSKAKLENDFALLEDRHRILIEKTLEEEENKEKAQKEKEMFMNELSKFRTESSAVTGNLHHFYQSQVETIVKTRTQQLETQLESLENQMEARLAERMQSSKTAYEKEREDLHRRHIDELNTLRLRSEAKENKLLSELKVLQKENKLLQSQRQAIVAAVSAIIPSSDLSFSIFGQQNHAQDRSLLLDGRPLGRNSHRPIGTVVRDMNVFRPEITTFKPFKDSTSFSSLSEVNAEDLSSEGRVTVRERKPLLEKRAHRNRDKSKSARDKNRNGGLGFKAAKSSRGFDLVDAPDCERRSPKPTSSSIFQEVDRTVTELVEEINSMSSIEPPQNFLYETPHHDTSLEQETVQKTLQKIDRVSNMLSGYVKK